MHYAFAYNYTFYILSKDGDLQQLLRDELKLVKIPISTAHSSLLLTPKYPQSCYICLASFMSKGEPLTLTKSIAKY